MANNEDAMKRAKQGDVDYFKRVELDVIQKARAEDGGSVLCWAAMNGHLECCEVIYRRCPQLLYEISYNGNNPVLYAAWGGHAEIIKFLLAARAKLEHGVNGIQSAGGGEELVDHRLLMMLTVGKRTALHQAACNGHVQCVKLLLEVDASNKLLGMETTDKYTAMHFAVQNHHVETVELLAETDPHFEYSANIHGNTPLLMALEGALLGDQRAANIRKILIEKQPGQCRVPTGTNKWSLIHHATHKGDLSAVKEIIHFWPDCCNLVDKEGHNFFHLAAMFDQVNIVRYSLEQINLDENVLNGKDNFGNTPLHLAISSGNQGITASLLDDPRVNKLSENVEGKKAFDLASSLLLGNLIKDNYPIQCASKGDTDFFRAIQDDVLKNSTDENGESVLSTAARKGHLNCCEVICERCPDLLYHTNKNGASVLHTAAYNGKDEIIKFLLGKIDQQGGRDIVDYNLLTMVSYNLQTALHLAVDRGHFQSAKLLILADPSNTLLRMTDNCKETPMHYAVKKHNLDIVKLLVEVDPDFEYSADGSSDTPLSIALQEALSGDQISVEIRNLLIQKQPTQCKVRIGMNGWTILQHATSKGDSSAIKEIIQSCPDCSELVDNEERNFLHLAIIFEHENVVKLILGLSSIGDHILNAQDINGNTPLHTATSKGNESTTKLLLYDRRVNKMIQNKQGQSALSAIRFPYDKRRAEVLGLISGVDEDDLKDQTSFDLLVGALISTVSFTAGITVPGGFSSDGRNKGMAILLKKGTFVAFVVSNTIALTLSLFSVFIHYCLKDIVDHEEITFQLMVARICSIGSIFAMMVAFISGSLSVLFTSLLLVLIVCGICSIFFGISLYFLWRKGKIHKRRHHDA